MGETVVDGTHAQQRHRGLSAVTVASFTSTIRGVPSEVVLNPRMA